MHKHILTIIIATVSTMNNIFAEKLVVTDSRKLPLPGVIVSVNDSIYGMTGLDGEYEYDAVSDNDKLTFEMVGMNTVVLKGSEIKENYTVVMTDEPQGLNELVVVGYGASRKCDLTGAVSSISPKESFEAESSNLIESLKGQMSGVTIKTSEGGTLSDAEIVIRGGTSITGDNSPLYVVDGFVVKNLDDVNPAEIERIDVLKDAASAAIYGSRASGGVINITTRHPKENGIHFDYESTYGFKRIAGSYSVLSPYDYARLCYEIAALKGGESYTNFVSLFGTYKELKKYRDLEGKDYAGELFGENGGFMRQSASISKVTDKSKMKLSYEFDKNDGIMIGSEEKRHGLTMYLSQAISPKCWLDVKGNYNNRARMGAGVSTEGTASNSRLKNALYFSPITMNGTDEDSYELGAQIYSPIEVTQDDYRRETRHGVNGDASLKIDINKHITISSSIGMKATFLETQRAYGLKTSQAIQFGNLPLASIRNDRSSTLKNTNLVTYSVIKSQRAGNLKFLFGEEFSKDKDRYEISQSKYFPSYFSARQTLANMSLGTAEPNVSYIYPNESMLSFFTRGEYDWRNRYICKLTLRADRSSKFKRGNQWGVFPSYSLAWRLSEESVWKKSQLRDLIPSAKIRFSHGTSGNNRISDNLFENIYLAPGENDPVLNFNHQYQSYIKGVDYMANQDITWETTVSRDLGLELSFAKERIHAEFDWYCNNTHDLLLRQELPYETGYEYMMKNVGETQNKGFEVSVYGDVVKKEKWGIQLYGNIAKNNNKVVSLGNDDEMLVSSGWAGSEITGDYILKVGESVGTMYGYETVGMYTRKDFKYNAEDETYTLKKGVASDAELLAISELKPGVLKLKDQNNDGIIDEQDRVILGSANPKCNGGFGLKAKCFGFDIAVDLYYSIGGKVLNASKIEGTTSNKYMFRNMLSEAQNHYTYIDRKGNIEVDPDKLDELNEGNDFWSPVIGRYIMHSWAVEDASFIRLDKITLGYNFSDKVRRKMHLQKFRLSAGVGNLKCWSKYSGFDPEVSVRRTTSATPNVDYSAYPRSRSFHFGLSISY